MRQPLPPKNDFAGCMVPGNLAEFYPFKQNEGYKVNCDYKSLFQAYCTVYWTNSGATRDDLNKAVGAKAETNTHYQPTP